MIDHAAVIARLEGLGLFRKVGGAARAAGIMQGKIAMGDGPEAYVAPMRDLPGQAHGTYEPIQAVSSRFGVMIMVRLAGDAAGGSGLAQIEQLQKDVQAGLIGWSPGAGYDPITWAGGSILDFQPQALWWLEEFASASGLDTEEDD